MSRLMMIFGALLLTACGGSEAPASQGAASVGTAASVQSGENPDSRAGGSGSGGADTALAKRQRELVNPDDATMVFLYYDVAGITPPLESWVELDRRLSIAAAADKAALRTVIRQELEVGAASVKGAGLIRLSLSSAKLSAYDPAYSEFTIRALAPSSVISYSDFRQKVELRFGNGREAQTWKVEKEDAQLINDRLGRYTAHAKLEVLLRLTGVQPGMGGGTLIVDVLEYELGHEDGTTLARVRVAS